MNDLIYWWQHMTFSQSAAILLIIGLSTLVGYLIATIKNIANYYKTYMISNVQTGEQNMISKVTGLGDYHGSASDRGSADRYYDRPRNPHYYPNGTGHGEPIAAKDMTQEEIAAYNNAFDEETERKDWG